MRTINNVSSNLHHEAVMLCMITSKSGLTGKHGLTQHAGISLGIDGICDLSAKLYKTMRTLIWKWDQYRYKITAKHSIL